MLKLPPLPTTGELIRLYNLSAKQQLSQNFILNLNITERIVKASGGIFGRSVLEVGPGPGSLTRSILQSNPRVLAVVEKDVRFLSALKTIQSALPPGKLDIHTGDILRVNERAIFSHINAESAPWDAKENPNLIIGNLPFGVATELLIKWIHSLPSRDGPFQFGRIPMVLMFQKEVAMRITAKPKTKEYGRLSVMVQNWCHARCLFDIDGSSFVPAPKVKATVVYIEPLIRPLAETNIEALEYVCRQAFGMRRKMMSNAMQKLNTIGSDSGSSESKNNVEQVLELLHMSKIDPKKRPEEINVEDWGRLANSYYEMNETNSILSPFTKELKRLHQVSLSDEIVHPRKGRSS